MALNRHERLLAMGYAAEGASFMFIPSESLRKKIVNDHPMTVGINAQLKVFMLEGKAIRLDPEMVVKYCKNMLSPNNTWLLDQGDIKVEPARIEIK